MAARDTLEDFQQEVTCPLCLDTFEDPRVLTCQHTYCKKCLESLLSRSISSTVVCPECRKTTQTSIGGVSDLPVAFKINRLKQLVSRMQLQEKEKAVVGQEVLATPSSYSRASTASQCVQHPSQPLDMYCRKCEEVVCRDCILFGKHSNHSYDKLVVAANEDRDTVAQKLRGLLKKQADVKKLETDAREASQSAEESCKIICAKISESYDRVINAVERKKQNSIQQFRIVAEERVQKLNERCQTYVMMSSEMGAVQSLVERGLRNLGNAEFLTRKKGMVLKLEQMNSRINNLSQDQPVAEPTPQVVDAKSVGEAEMLCDRFLHPYQIVDPLKCTAKVNNGDSIIRAGDQTFINVYVKDSEGEVCNLLQSVTVELSCARFGETISAAIIEHSPLCYKADITPNVRTRGRCNVVVKVNENIIGNRPLTVFIDCPPCMLGEPVCIINDIQQPGCLKIVNDRMFCRTASGLCILDLENTSKPPVQSGIFPRDGKIDSWWPSEMAIDKNCLFVSDPKNGKIHKFKIDGQFMMSTSTNKSSVKTPNGLSVAPDGAVYVCDSDNHCIHVFNPDLSLRLTFGSQGSAPGQFNWPDNIAFDSSGNMFVTDYSNHRIQCFTSDHVPKWYTGTPGNRPENLNEPNVMQVIGDKIFVTDLGGVSVFSTQGQFITRFADMCAASESKSSADGIAIDKDGFVIVSDTPRNRLVVF